MENIFKVFDKAKWHLEKNKDIEHLFAVMIFLKEHDMLSDEGNDIFINEGVDKEFSLNSDILNKRGVSFLDKEYSSYLSIVSKAGVNQGLKFLQEEYVKDYRTER